AYFVNNFATAGNPPIIFDAMLAGDNAASVFDDGLEGFLHVLGLQDLVLTPFEVEAQNRDTPFIDHVRIDFTVAVVIGDHLSTAGEVHRAAVQFAKVALQLDT